MFVIVSTHAPAELSKIGNLAVGKGTLSPLKLHQIQVG